MGKASRYGDNADDFYFSALYAQDDVFPISDERYAEELQLQEALMSSILSTKSSSSDTTAKKSFRIVEKGQSSFSSSSDTTAKKRFRIVEKGQSSSSSSSSSSSQMDTDQAASLCMICAEAKLPSQMFHNTTTCSHAFCTDCIRRHIAAKLQDNISTVRCPHVGCRGVLVPDSCRDVIPADVFERWADALCDSLVLGSRGMYCPFKDCSAFLLDENNGEKVRESECPCCRRLFCAQCKVPWHAGVDCEGLQSKGQGDLMLEQLAVSKKWRRCPRCKFYVEKTEGCLHITCRCGFQFCYGCGATWSDVHASCRP